MPDINLKPDDPRLKTLFWISVSKIKTFKDCPAKYKFSYIDRLPKKDWEHFVFGKFLHEVLEVFYTIRPDVLGTNREVMEDLAYQKALETWGSKLTPENLAEAQNILTRFLEKLDEEEEAGKSPQIVALEKEIKFNILDTILLTGYIDCFRIDHDSMPHVIDYKTNKPDKKTGRADKYLKKDFLQLQTYAYFICLENPEIERVRTSYLLLRQNCDLITEEFSRKELMKVEDKLLEHYQEMIQEKLYRPNPTILCQYCDYLEKCKAGQDFVRMLDKTPKFGSVDW